MGWHDGFYGNGGFGGHGPDPAWGLFMLLGPALWLLTPLLITAVYFWLRNHQRRPALAGQAASRFTGADALEADEPSAFELLRRRYVLGEIDAPAFEAMTERLLISERAEQLSPPAIRSARYDGYDHYLRRDQGERAAGSAAPADVSAITWL